MGRTFLGLTAILLAGAAASAQPAPLYQPAATHDEQTAALTESRLSPAASWSQPPPDWTGDIPEPGLDPWMAERRAQHRSFLTPFVLPSVFPEVTARLSNVAGWHKAASATDLDQFALLSLYFLDVYVPLVTLRDSESVSAQSFRVNLKVPWVLGNSQAVTLFFGGDIPVQGRLVDGGGFDTMLGYAYGAGIFSGQARAGVGVDRLLADARGDISPSVLYDLAVGVQPLWPVQIIAQVDGRKVVGADNASVRLWPGVRLFPMRDRALSIGVGGMFWFDDAGGGWQTHRIGGLIDVGYLFL